MDKSSIRRAAIKSRMNRTPKNRPHFESGCGREEKLTLSPEDAKFIFDECIQSFGALTEDGAKQIFQACLSQLPEIHSESHLKLIIQNCIESSGKSDEELKLFVQSCVRSDAELNVFILEKICENPKAFLQAETAKPLIQECISKIVFPDGVSDSHIKAVSLQCFLDQESWIRGLVAELLPEPADVKGVVLQCLLDNPGLTEDRVKTIVDSCMEGKVPDEQTIKAIFETCVHEWGIAPNCVKDFVYEQVVKLLPRPMSAEEIKCFIEDCFGTRLHEKNELLEYINQALLSAPKPRSNEEIIALVNQEVTNERIKLLILECLNDTPGREWTELELTQLFNGLNDTRTDAELKLFIQSCVNIPTTELIEQISKTVATACISEQVPGPVPDSQIKSLILDCLKDLPFSTAPAETVGYSFCWEFNPSSQFSENDGKVTLPLTLSAGTFSGGNAFATFNVASGDLELPYSGPTKQDIRDCAAEVLADNGTGITGEQAKAIAENCITQELMNAGFSTLTAEQAKAIAQSCVDALPTASSYCLTAANVESEGSRVTVTLSQENCPDDVEFTFNVGDQGSVECCNEALVVVQDGDDYELTLSQTNGPDVVGNLSVQHPTPPSYCVNTLELTFENGAATVSLDQENCDALSASATIPTYCITGTQVLQQGSIVTVGIEQENCPDVIEFSFTAGQTDGGSVECCNTNANLEVDVEGKSVTVTIEQSAGAAVSATMDLTELFESLAVVEELTDVDGCSRYRSVKFCGQELGPFPIFEPKTCCRCLIVPENFEGEVRIRLVESGTDFSVDWGDGSSPSTGASGNFVVHQYEPNETKRKIQICNLNACDEFIYQIEQEGLPEDAVCSDCEC